MRIGRVKKTVDISHTFLIKGGMHRGDHNLREQKAIQGINSEHINQELSYKNVIFEHQDIKDFYKIFEKDYKEFYDKHLKMGKVMNKTTGEIYLKEDYLSTLQMRSSNAKSERNSVKTNYECIIQLGNKEKSIQDFVSYEEQKEIFREQYELFKTENPNYKIISAIAHFDEATPHLHIGFAPVVEKEEYELLTGKKMRGQSMQVSKSKADELIYLKRCEREQKTPQRTMKFEKENLNNFREKSKQLIRETTIFNPIHKGTTHDHFDKNTFIKGKEKEKRKEIEKLLEEFFDKNNFKQKGENLLIPIKEFEKAKQKRIEEVYEYLKNKKIIDNLKEKVEAFKSYEETVLDLAYKGIYIDEILENEELQKLIKNFEPAGREEKFVERMDIDFER